YAAETGTEVFHRLDDLIGVLCVEAEGKRVHSSQILEEESLPFHHGKAGQRTDIPQTEDATAVAHDGHHVRLVRVKKDLFRVPLDVFAGLCDPRRVPDGKIIDVPNHALGHHF